LAREDKTLHIFDLVSLSGGRSGLKPWMPSALERNQHMALIYASPWRAAAVGLIGAGVLWVIFAQLL